MRALRLLLLALVIVAAGCARNSGVLILDARVSRTEDQRIITEVQLEAVNQGGGSAGPYCVSVHWFGIGFNPFTEETTTYPGELELVEQCFDDLSDGDQRTIQLVTTRTDLAKDLPARVQVREPGPVFRTKEGVFAP